jgi:FkbM family methyltransferase
VDVGGNIGWYSLLSAAMGAKVDVFEPNRVNYLRTCESLCINDWLDEPCKTMGDLAVSGSRKDGRIRIFPLGIGRKEDMVYFEAAGVAKNPGAGKVVTSDRQHSTKSSKKLQQIRLLPLDKVAADLRWYSEDIDILKIDVEGFELDVLMGAKSLLKSHRVKNIFLEGDTTKEEKFYDFVRIFESAGYMAFKIGGYSGPQDTDVPPMNENITKTLYHRCRGNGMKPRKKCNLWWKLPT